MWCGVMKGNEDEQTGCGMLRMWGVYLIGGGMDGMFCLWMGLRGWNCGVVWCDAMKGKRGEQRECKMLSVWGVDLVVKGKGWVG